MTELTETNDKNLPFPWQILTVFGIYRLFLIVIISVTYTYYHFIHASTIYHTLFVAATCFVYGVVALLLMYATYKHKLYFNHLTIISVVSDIILLTLLTYATKELAITFGVLMNISIAAGSIIVPGRISLFFAALGVISILLSQVIGSLQNNAVTLDFIQKTGFLCITFFVTAILAYSLSKRTRESEFIARQTKADMITLEKINALIVKNMQQGILVIDEHDRITVSNKAAWFILGLPERLGKPVLSEVAPALMSYLQTWRKNPMDLVLPQALFEMGIYPKFSSLAGDKKTTKATLIILEDSAQLSKQAQQIKLASLGRLTASIAHEIRNPLSAISHAAQLLDEAKVTSKKNRLIEIINNNCQRVNSLIENVLRLSRRKDSVTKIIDFKKWIPQFIQNLMEEMNEEIDIEVKFLAHNHYILFDATQLQQVLYKLCENGLYYSMEKIKLPKLIIIEGELIETNQLYLDICDYGEGVPDEFIDYIFEPFFTTKTTGTGLGLYIARELCQSNGARIFYYKTEELKSCFRIVFSKMDLGLHHD